jgi:hypothetical protein
MSGREKCFNLKCEDYGYEHEGMCVFSPWAERTVDKPETEKTNMKHTLTLNLIGVTRNQLEGLIAATPEHAEFSTNVVHLHGDRPWESDSFKAELEASWDA